MLCLISISYTICCVLDEVVKRGDMMIQITITSLILYLFPQYHIDLIKEVY